MALTETQKNKLDSLFSLTGSGIPAVDTKAIAQKVVAQNKSTGFMADIRGIGTGIKEDIATRTEKVAGIQESNVSPLRKLVQTLGQSAGAISNVIGQTVVGGVKALTPQSIQEPVGGAIKSGAEAITNLEPVQQLIQSYQSLPEEKKRDVDAILGFGELALDITGAGLGFKGGKQVVKVGKEAIETGITKATPMFTKGIEKGKELFTGKQPVLTDTISPKITARETRNIVREGRVTQPSESIIFGKKPDIIEPTERIKKAAEIIETKIPKANKYDQYQLANEIDVINTNTAKALKPALKTVEIQQDTTQRIKNAWKTVKKTQTDNPEFSAFAGATKAQQNFETFLNQINKRVRGADGKFRNRDLDDLWSLRKQYDSSVSESVKRATSQSAPSTQLQHDMWLQNRDILNEVIEEMSESLPKNARKSFEEMNLLYEARNNLINKAKIDIKGKAGMFSTKNVLKGLLAGTAAKFLIFQ